LNLSEASLLVSCLDLVSDLDSLEGDFSKRLQIAREAASVEKPRLSRSATEEASQSIEANVEFHRLLSRRCRRADSAETIVRELVTAAEGDLEMTEFLLEGAPDASARLLLNELAAKKRAAVQCLKTFLSQSI